MHNNFYFIFLLLINIFFCRLSNFFDEDTPLSYKYHYYLSEDDYKNEKENGSNAIPLERNTIFDFRNENEVKTILPTGNLLLMVSVSDSKGAVSNITIKINVQLP